MGMGQRATPSLRPSVTNSADGSTTVTYTHATFTSAPGVASLQMFGALFFSSYFFFWAWMVFGLYMMARCNVVSSTGALMIGAAYIANLFVSKPHKGSGWPFHWFLYGPTTDLVLGYHGATCIREGPAPDPNGKYLFAMAPHGVFGVCRAFSGGRWLWRQIYPGIAARWGSFGAAFFIPGVREFSLCCGCLDASKSVLTRAIVERKENIILLPGGEKEMMLTDGSSKVTKLVLGERTGFVRLAITHGMSLVPGFCFGEKWVHESILLPKPVRAFLYKRFKVAGQLLRGRFYCTFLGHVVKADGITPLTLGYAWGVPIDVRHEPNPSDEYVMEVHAKYIKAIEGLFERHKARFGYDADETIEVVSAKKAA